MNRPLISKLVFWATAFFLILPLLVLALYSFNESRSFSWSGFSWRWYEKLFTESQQLWNAALNSLVVAFLSSLIATGLGSLGAIGLSWYRFPLKPYALGLSFVPLVLPEIVLGVGILVFFNMVNLPLGMPSIVIAHVTFTLPFVLLMVMARLAEFDFSIIEASRDLGASEWQTLVRVILPLSAPGILSGFLTAFTLSLEDFVVTLFVAGPGSSTLPLYIFSSIRFGVTPTINAFSVLLLLGTVLLAVSARRLFKYIVKS